MINDIIYERISVYADVAELADALDLGSSGRPCRFDSCHPHHQVAIKNIAQENPDFIGVFAISTDDFPRVKTIDEKNTIFKSFSFLTTTAKKSCLL